VVAAKEAEIAASLASQDGDAAAAAAAAATAAKGRKAFGQGARQGRAGAVPPAPVASRDDDDDELKPDWALARPQSQHRGGRYKAKQQQLDKPTPSSSIEKLLHDAHLDEAAAAAEEKLKLAAAGAEGAMKRALKKAAPTPRQQFILIRWAQKAAGALVGLATAAFLLFYQWVVEPAPPTSLRVKAFATVAQVRSLMMPL
jgi:hypothetical protein